MPTYEYECKKCGYRFEHFQGMNDALLKKCPECGKLLKRLIGTGAGIIFKGSGFYATDYRSKSYNEKKVADSDKPACPAAANKTCSNSSCPKANKG